MTEKKHKDDYPFCHARLDRASRVLGLHAGFRPRTTRGGDCGVSAPRDEGEGCGVSPPHDEVLLFRQKNPKPVAPGRGPQEGVPVPRSLLCGLRNSLRSDSPRRHMEGTGPGHSPARRRREAAFVSSVMPGLIGHPAFCHARLRSGIQGCFSSE